MPTTIFPEGYTLLPAASELSTLSAAGDLGPNSPDPIKLLLPPTEGMRKRFISGVLVNAAIIGALALNPTVHDATVPPNPQTIIPIRLVTPNLPKKVTPRKVPAPPQRTARARQFVPPTAVQKDPPVVEDPPEVQARKTEIASAIPALELKTAPVVQNAVPSLKPVDQRLLVPPSSGTATGGDRLAPVEQRKRGAGSGSGRGDGGPLPNLPPQDPITFTPKPPPEQAFKPDETKPPKILFMPKPSYPAGPRARKVQGDVIIDATFDRSGRVEFRHFVQRLSDDEINSEARRAVLAIKFEPAESGGRPVNFDVTITVQFNVSEVNVNTSYEEPKI